MPHAHDVLLASDEAYSELWFDDGPPLERSQVGDLTNVVVLNTLSEALVDDAATAAASRPATRPDRGAASALRSSVGVTPQEFVQRAERRRLGRRGATSRRTARGTRRSVPSSSTLFARRRACSVAGSEATFYLWVAVPGRRPSMRLGDRAPRSERPSSSRPGSFFGPEGEGTCGMAMVPTLAGVRAGAPRLLGAAPVAGGARVSDDARPRRIERDLDGGQADRAPPIDVEAVEDADRGARPRRGPRRRARRRRRAWTRQRSGSKQAVLLYFRVRGLETHRVRPVRVPRQAAARSTATRPSASASVPPATVRYGALLEPGVVADAELRQHRRVGRRAARWSTRGRRSARARRSAPTCTWPAASASAACSSRCRPRPS